jgi:hypothetical protein
VALPGGAQTEITTRLPGYGPLGVAVDATSIYWTTPAPDEHVIKMPLAGGPPKLLTSGLPVGYGLAVDTTSVYFTGGDSVTKVPLDGGTPTTLASGQNQPNALVVDATNVYWTTLGTGQQRDATVMKVPLAGGTPTVIATGPSLWGLAIDATNVYWLDPVTEQVHSAPK